LIAENPGRQRNRRADGFDGAGRQIDDQAVDIAPYTGFQFGRNQFNMPIVEIGRIRVELDLRAMDK
jgi:hypothetical protein